MTPPVSPRNNGDKNKDGDDARSESGTKSIVDEFSSFVSQCRIALSDLQLSAELLETAILNRDLEAVQVEMADAESCSIRYNAAFSSLLEVCTAEA